MFWFCSWFGLEHSVPIKGNIRSDILYTVCANILMMSGNLVRISATFEWKSDYSKGRNTIIIQIVTVSI